jgi:hypothetical protein
MSCTKLAAFASAALSPSEILVVAPWERAVTKRSKSVRVDFMRKEIKSPEANKLL